MTSNPASVLLWVCVAVFCATAIVTLLALIGVVRLGGGSSQDHSYYMRRLFHALILEIVVTVVAFFGGYLKRTLPRIAVPPVATIKANELPKETDVGFELLRDVSVWDLRGW